MTRRKVIPIRMITIEAKNKFTGVVETFRYNEALTNEDAIARTGYQLAKLGWALRDVQIKSVTTGWEDLVSASRRERLHPSLGS